MECQVRLIMNMPMLHAMNQRQGRDREGEQSERKKEGNGLKDRQGVVGKRVVKCFHISFECELCISFDSFQALE